MAEKKYYGGGKYAVLRANNNNRIGEATNIGVIVFGEDGKCIGYKADSLNRAIARGDCSPYTEFDPVHYLSTYPDLAEVEKAYNSMGNAMSTFRLGNLMGTLLCDGIVDDLYETFIPSSKQ